MIECMMREWFPLHGIGPLHSGTVLANIIIEGGLIMLAGMAVPAGKPGTMRPPPTTTR